MSAMLGVAAKLLESLSSSKRRVNVPKETLANERHAQQLLHPSGLSVPELNPNRVRVVVFRDEKGMKQPVFDSQQLTSEEGEEPCTRSLCDMRYGERLDASLSSSSNGITGSSTHSAGWTTQSGKSRRGLLVKRPSTDSELLGEMMFGSMPMKVIGDTVKVHYIRSTDQLMLSKVFTSQRKVLAQCSLTDFTESCPLPRYSPARSMERSFSVGPKGPRQVSPDVTRPQSSTLSVPGHSHHLSSSLSSSPSNHSPPSPLNSLTVPAMSSSLTRRIQRSRSTSLENGSELYRKVLKPLDQHSNGSGRKKRKYAIGVIISLSELNKTDIRHFQSFIFSHFPLIDAHLERLKIGVEEACTNKNQGLVESAITKAYETYLQDFLSLYRAPRIESPVWLSLVSHVDRRKEVCMQFMEELASAIVDLDTKETKYFLSSLLTAVLSHHLAWIYTVSHQQSSSESSRHGKHCASKSLGVLAESHPYNPLWAQLGDLFGSVSNPLKVCRTIVTGQSSFIISRLLYLLTYFIRCSEVEPGFSQDPVSPPNASLLSHQPHTLGVKIPTTSAPVGGGGGADQVPYDISQLDPETEVFGSRASSVTVMSELDRQSLFSPYASPVNNQGADTPIVRPHPFSIRAGNTPFSMTSPSGDHRKGSQSESDSIDSLHLRRHDSASSGTATLRLSKKPSGTAHSSDLSPSQASHSSLRKNSPLISSARQTSSQVLDTPEEPEMSDAPHRCNCHYGNPTTCATIASCESMGMCPIEDGFLTFDPSQKPRTASHVDPCQNHLQNKMEDEYSLGHLASCGFLGPAHSLDSTASLAPPSHTSCSSLDSGYDQSWSLTNSSRDSTEFAGSFVLVGSNKNVPLDSAKCACSEHDSGRGSQCSCPKDRGCRRALYFSDVTNQEACSTLKAGQGMAASSTKLPSGGALPLCHSLPPNGRGRVGVDTTVRPAQSEIRSNDSVCDPTNSLFPMKFSNSDLSKLNEELFSPLSPEPLDGPDHTPLGGVAVSSDPLKPLPMRKLKNHIRTIAHSRNTGSQDNKSSSSLSDYQICDPNDPECSSGCRQFECVDTRQSAATSSLSGTTSLPMGGGSIGGGASQLKSSYRTSSVPVSRTNCATPPPSSSSRPSSSLSSNHTPSRPLPLHTSFDSRSICSEADSGRGTKSSLKTGELDTRSLSQISEMSYEMDPESNISSLCTLSLPHHHLNERANSSPPTTDSQSRPRPNEEACPTMTRGYGSFPMLARVQSKEGGVGNEVGVAQDGVGSPGSKSYDLALHSLKPFRNDPSILQQQLHRHDEAVESGCRPSTLEQFDDFTDVLLPKMDDFHLDMPTHGHRKEEQAVHRHPMSDFGHSLFVGLSPRYLPDFVLHGTTESADQAFQDKLLKDLAHTVRHSIIDEPVEYGVGIVADTDTWTVKVVAASKSVQTSDVIFGSGLVQASKCVRQMLSSVKSMHHMRMPPEFCLSYVEDCLMALNESGIMLAESLTEKPDVDLSELLPKVTDSLSISPTDVSLLLPVAAVNCRDPDLAARCNYLCMQRTLGKHFI